MSMFVSQVVCIKNENIKREKKSFFKEFFPLND
jgi:hypothetical protein